MYLFIYLIFYLFIYLFICLFIYLFIQDSRFSIYIFIKYIKTTAFQTSPAEKKRNKRLKFQISSFKQQILGRNFSNFILVSLCKFQGETKIKIPK